MDKIKIDINKSLKLLNVLVSAIDTNESKIASNTCSIGILNEQMESQIKAKGKQPVGPIIQYVNAEINKQGEMTASVKLMRQASEYIEHVDAPYHMEQVISVANCMYARYQGPEDKLMLAYQKLQIAAFEEDISLKGDSYTIFLGENDDDILVDIFMEKTDGD